MKNYKKILKDYEGFNFGGVNKPIKNSICQYLDENCILSDSKEKEFLNHMLDRIKVAIDRSSIIQKIKLEEDIDVQALMATASCQYRLIEMIKYIEYKLR
jgi:hypothetical protein